MTGILQKYLYTFMIIFRWIIAEWEMCQKEGLEKTKTHSSC
jgi:hypothetical protein